MTYPIALVLCALLASLTVFGVVALSTWREHLARLRFNANAEVEALRNEVNRYRTEVAGAVRDAAEAKAFAAEIRLKLKARGG